MASRTQPSRRSRARWPATARHAASELPRATAPAEQANSEDEPRRAADPGGPSAGAPSPEPDNLLSVHAYTVWAYPAWPSLRGVHTGGRAAWAALSRTFPSGSYGDLVDAGLHLR
eukprot:1161053-Heterocapsa_arctica.AAC.1